MSLIIYLLLAFLFTISYLVLFRQRKHEKVNPPPGPKGLPIIGNLHQFDISKPHVYLTNLAKTYGPILGLRFGRVPVLVVQSAKLAKEVLQTQDLNFSNRAPLVASQKLSYNGLDIIGHSYDEYFREMKKMMVVHLLSSKRVESFAPITQEEVSRMITKISSLAYASKTVNLSELLMAFASSNICRIAFGKRYEGEGESENRFQNLLNESQALFITTFFANCFPYAGWLDTLIGNNSRLERTFKKMDAFCEELINDHLDPNKPKSEREDIIDVLLNLRIDHGLTLAHIKALLVDIFIAGSDTSPLMTVWAMTELIRNPTIMEKVQREIRDEIQDKKFVSMHDLPKLKYFKTIVKETFRLHPAAPLLIPHATANRTIINGYDILPNTLVFVNVWAIGRDPESWTDPDNFVPERFMESSIDFKGYDFELLPFGAGRRMCPGVNLGVVNMELALANLLYSFDWELPAGITKEEIDTDVLPGLAMHKKNPLCLVAKEFSTDFATGLNAKALI